MEHSQQHADNLSYHASDDEASLSLSDDGSDMFDMFTGEPQAIGIECELDELDAFVLEEESPASAQQSDASNSLSEPLETAAWEQLTTGQIPADQDPTDEDCVYPRLQPNSIRKLDIAPAASSDGELELRLLQGYTDQSDYIALSYAWGATFEDGSHFTHTVSLNGRPFRITKTLYDALLAIRRKLDVGQWHDFAKRPYVWADAICINQHDVNEKNDQVQRMDKIYQQARRVIVHLGHANDVDCERLVLAAKAIVAGTIDHCMASQLYAELRSLLLRPWFSRRWVIQEFALNSRRSILLGDAAIDGQYFTTVLSHYYSHATVGNDSGVVDYAGPIFASTSLFDSPSPRRWLPANLFLFRKSKCSDPRDKLYSLLSISCGCSTAQIGSQHGGPTCHSGVSVDYNMPMDNLLFNLARKWVEHDIMGMLALSSVSNDASTVASKTSSQRPNPTWVPSSIDPIFSAPESTRGQVQNFWDTISVAFFPIPRWLSYKNKFTFEDGGWDVRKDFPPPRSPTTCYTTIAGRVHEDGRPSDNYVIGFSAKDGEWRIHQGIPARLKANPKILVLSGWLLQQAQKTPTRPEQLVWNQPAKSRKSLIPWKSKRREPQPFMIRDSNYMLDQPYQVSAARWPTLLPNQVVLLVFRYKLALILQKTQHENRYHFIRCVVRSGGISHLRFAWVQEETGYVWAYGSIEEPPVEVEII